LKIIHYIRKNIRDFSPDVLVSFGVWINSYIILSTRFLNIPLFISDRMGPKLYLGLLLETARKLTYKYATGIIAQTKIAAEIIRRQTKAENIEVIPNAINVIDTDVSIKKNQIVTTGRLSVEKGHTILLNAFSRINHKDWTLHIVGDGPERGNLLDEAKSLGIQDKIVFYGQLKDFSTILGVSKIFVLSSYYEGFPNALVEAMSVPLACISTDCIAGPADIIQNGMNGLLVPTGDCDALRDALERLIENIELQNYLSKNAFKIRVTLNFELIAQRYLNFFTQSLNQA
jgi:glycosyltransferase involved in cell wall biosynthesis